jgi:hypothetical protein
MVSFALPIILYFFGFFYAPLNYPLNVQHGLNLITGFVQPDFRFTGGFFNNINECPSGTYQSNVYSLNKNLVRNELPFYSWMLVNFFNVNFNNVIVCTTCPSGTCCPTSGLKSPQPCPVSCAPNQCQVLSNTNQITCVNQTTTSVNCSQGHNGPNTTVVTCSKPFGVKTISSGCPLCLDGTYSNGKVPCQNCTFSSLTSQSCDSNGVQSISYKCNSTTGNVTPSYGKCNNCTADNYIQNTTTGPICTPCSTTTFQNVSYDCPPSYFGSGGLNQIGNVTNYYSYVCDGTTQTLVNSPDTSNCSCPPYTTSRSINAINCNCPMTFIVNNITNSCDCPLHSIPILPIPIPIPSRNGKSHVLPTVYSCQCNSGYVNQNPDLTIPPNCVPITCDSTNFSVATNCSGSNIPYGTVCTCNKSNTMSTGTPYICTGASKNGGFSGNLTCPCQSGYGLGADPNNYQIYDQSTYICQPLTCNVTNLQIEIVGSRTNYPFPSCNTDHNNNCTGFNFTYNCNNNTVNGLLANNAYCIPDNCPPNSGKRFNTCNSNFISNQACGCNPELSANPDGTCT